MPELCLPHGWIVKTSTKYPDKSYYFNVVTGCSVWECPTLEPKSDALKNTPTALSSSSKGIKQKRKKVKATNRHKNDLIPNPLAKDSVVEKKQQSQNKKQVLKTSPPKKTPKRKLIADPQPSTNTTSNESNESTDSDVILEFRPSGLDSIVLSVGELNPYDSNEDDSTDVEMTDLSVSIKSVDIGVAIAELSNQLLSYYIVCDTNIFVHELHHIEELIDIPFEGCGPPHIVIPWVVFNELDGLKKSKKKGTREGAIEAIRFLNTVFKAKHPRFHGQTGREAAACQKSYHSKNDDKIIDCCQTLLTRLPPEKVILMTNDINFDNKAMVCDFNVHNWESLFKDLTPDVLLLASPSKKRKISKKESDPAKRNRNSQKLFEVCTFYATEIDNAMNKAKRMLKDALDPLLAEEMKKAYGDKWLEFKIDRKHLSEILAVYIKYWPIVFSLRFENNAKAYFELLHQKMIHSHEPYNTLEKCLHVLRAIREIFESIRCPMQNTTTLMNDIQILMDTCRYIFSKCGKEDSSLCALESIIRKAEEKSVLEVLNHNWAVINELCGMAMDYFGVQHSFIYSKPASNPPESEYRLLVADLYPSLLKLNDRMKNMLDNVKNDSPSKMGFKNLFTALKELLPPLNIKCVMPTMTNFTPRGVERYFRDPINRERINIGCQQLDNFCSKLKEANQVMMSQKSKLTIRQKD